MSDLYEYQPLKSVDISPIWRQKLMIDVNDLVLVEEVPFRMYELPIESKSIPVIQALQNAEHVFVTAEGKYIVGAFISKVQRNLLDATLNATASNHTIVTTATLERLEIPGNFAKIKGTPVVLDGQVVGYVDAQQNVIVTSPELANLLKAEDTCFSIASTTPKKKTKKKIKTFDLFPGGGHELWSKKNVEKILKEDFTC